MSPWHELFAEEQMSVLAAKGKRGFVCGEEKNNLLIWLVHQKLKVHPQRHKSPAFPLAGAGSGAQQKLDGGTATKGHSGDSLWCCPALQHPTHPCSSLMEGTKKEKQKTNSGHDVWLPPGSENSCLSSFPA